VPTFSTYIKYLFILFKNSLFTFLYTRQNSSLINGLARASDDINDNDNISKEGHPVPPHLFYEEQPLNDKKEGAPRSSTGKDNEERFYEWLAGVIDGDGCFLLSKKGYASLEITTQLRDKKILYLIKQKFGGSVKLYSGDNYLRYRLHHKEGLLNLINKVNGLLRNPIRILQLGKICEIYNIELKDPKSLTYYNGWLAGFFDTDGSIYLNDASGQIFITATQKKQIYIGSFSRIIWRYNISYG